MAAGFNLTAQLNLRGPSNVGAIVADIRKQLGSITANVNFKINPSATNNVTQLNAALQKLNNTLNQTTSSASSAAAALKNLSSSIGNIQANNLSINLNAAVNNTNKLSQASSAASTQIKQLSSETFEFGKQAGLAFRRFSAFSAVTSVIYGLTNSINQGLKAYIEYDRELIRLQQVTDQSA